VLIVIIFAMVLKQAFGNLFLPRMENYVLIMNVVYTIVFTYVVMRLYWDSPFTTVWWCRVEALLRIISLGFVMHRGAYLRDTWNIIDFFVVLLLWHLILIRDHNDFAIR
jgi:hypothetical protein